MPLTVTALKELFQDQIAPGDDEKFLRILQEAEIALIEAAKWYWTKARVTLSPVNGIVTLPPQYAAIIGARSGSAPVGIDVMDYEFYPGGQGEVDVEGSSFRLIDQGLDDSDQRTYKLTGAPDGWEFTAILHKAPATLYDPEIADSSLPEDVTEDVTCPDARALKLCMLAIIFEEAHDLAASRDYMATAYARLNEKEKTRRGNAQATPAVRPQGKGVRPIRSFR